jgi:hypothetical protein
MRSRRAFLLAFAAAAISAAAVGVFLAVGHGAGRGHGAGSGSGGLTVCVDPAEACTAAELRERPRTMVVTGDGSGYMTRISWASWGGAEATGAGTYEGDTCVPSCAQGTFKGYPATLTLSGPSHFRAGRQMYTRVTIVARGAGFRRTYGIKLGRIPTITSLIRPGGVILQACACATGPLPAGVTRPVGSGRGADVGAQRGVRVLEQPQVPAT